MILSLLLATTAQAEAPPSADAGASALVAAMVADFRQDGVRVPDAEVGALYQTACDAGEALACERSWRAGDLQAAARALKAACDDGHDGACVAVAWAATQQQVGSFDDTIDPETPALPLLRAACSAGIERGCVDTGVLLSRGVEGVEGVTEALKLLQTSCQVGDLEGCRRLGMLYHSGRGLPRELDKARTYYDKACAGGHAAGCNGVALLDHLGVGGVEKDLDAAEANYRKACDAGFTKACDNLEKLYRAGPNPDVDAAGALALWKRGCERGVAAACANGGRLADDERMGEDRDPALADALLGKGCEGGDPFTCALLGERRLTDDPAKAEALLTGACTAGVGMACASYADALWSGDTFERDRKRARALYRTACDDGVESACKRAR